MHEAFAQLINWGHVFRDNRVYEPGAFTGVIDRDRMGASVEVVDVVNPDDYEVHLTSGISGPVDIYLTHYRQNGPTSWEYVNSSPLALPGSAWENVWYTFEIVDAVTKNPVGSPLAYWYIPSGDVTEPVPFPAWVTFSDNCLELDLQWDNVLDNLCPVGPYTGHYQIRVYPLNPDGSFDYVTWSSITGKFPCPEYTLTNLCSDCQSVAIGVASRINYTGADPLGGGLVNRSQYYFRYDPCININVDIKPGSYPNCFNSDGKGAIPVAILSSDVFDATLVDPSTIALDGQGVRVVGRGNIQAHIEDVNGDGLEDLMVQIQDVDGTYEADDTIATLTAETFTGYPIMGTDSICIVP